MYRSEKNIHISRISNSVTHLSWSVELYQHHNCWKLRTRQSTDITTPGASIERSYGCDNRRCCCTQCQCHSASVWVFHDVSLVVHNVLRCFTIFYECLTMVLRCLANRAMNGISTCTISNCRIGYRATANRRRNQRKCHKSYPILNSVLNGGLSNSAHGRISKGLHHSTMHVSNTVKKAVISYGLHFSSDIQCTWVQYLSSSKLMDNVFCLYLIWIIIYFKSCWFICDIELYYFIKKIT